MQKKIEAIQPRRGGSEVHSQVALTLLLSVVGITGWGGSIFCYLILNFVRILP